jgi:hypothetical protein
MRIPHKALMLAFLPLILVSAVAVGGLNPSSVLLASERINGFTKIPIALSPDETGRGNVAWTAVSVDPRSRRCGHASSTGLTDSQAVSIHADSDCSGP